MRSVSTPALDRLSVTDLPQVGAERGLLLERLNVRTQEELLLLSPRRHEDRRAIRTIGELATGEAAMCRGEIAALGVKRYAQGRKSMFEIIVEDGTGRLHCRWWNAAYMAKRFKRGDTVWVYGKVRSAKPWTIDHPETELIEGGEDGFIHLNRIVPIYPLTEGLSQRGLRSLMWRALEQLDAEIDLFFQADPVPGLLDRSAAVRLLHFPNERGEPERARQRLAFDELLEMQTTLRQRRLNLEAKAPAREAAGDNRLIRPFLRSLPFSLTASQTAVLKEIRDDLGRGVPMRRLLQGDVGSGKTVVAACAALMAIESGYTAALMAPTEILAEQHARTFREWFRPLGLGVALQTGTRKELRARPDSSEELFGDLAGTTEPAPQFVVGTHALIEDPVRIENLGLILIDEQHKFGVQQREQLLRKGRYPHLLVMTATPIPRTLGLTLYGDLDISSIRELPAGRKRIRTFVRTPDKLPKVYEFIREQIRRGRQAYLVYPRIEEGEPGELKSVVREFERMAKELAPCRVGLLHGRLAPEEKERVMGDFRANAIHALVATQVIEVGIDVPNATVMLIENAEQFGLAQLHQLRGRIGRGPDESYCVLVASAKTDAARRRLEILAQSEDGFEIGEADLKLRGPGDFLGAQQSGLPPLRFADLMRDGPLISLAREQAASRDRQSQT